MLLGIFLKYKLAETLNDFEFHRLQTEFLPRKYLKSNNSSFTILSWSAFNSAFVANVAVFLSKSGLSINVEILDLSTNPFFIYLSLHQVFHL